MADDDAQLEVRIDFDGYIAGMELAEIVEQVERGVGGLAIEFLLRSEVRGMPLFSLGISAVQPGSVVLLGQVGNTANLYSEKVIGSSESTPEVREKIVRFLREVLPGRMDTVQWVVDAHYLRGARERGSRLRGVRVELITPGREIGPQDPATPPLRVPPTDDSQLEIVVAFDGMIAGKELSEIIEVLDTGLLRAICADHPGYSRLLSFGWTRPLFCLQEVQSQPLVLRGFFGRTSAGYGLLRYQRPLEGELPAWESAAANLHRKLQAQPASVLEEINRTLASLVDHRRAVGSHLISASVRLQLAQ